MTIPAIVARRGIAEVVHFTTSKGVLGTLDSGAILSRPLVRTEERLEYIMRLNTPIVKDAGWERYVNLSITTINRRLFDFSANQWHPDLWWAILALEPEILSHDGVFFVTTNNIYPSRRRAGGADGLEAMFADPVYGRYNFVHRRPNGMPDNLTTDNEAEVLYPERISSEFVRTIYVAEHDHADQVCSHIALVGHRDIPVVVAPERFAH